MGFASLAGATAYTCTWTGTAGDHAFSTAGNWSGCNNAAPQVADHDDLVFPATASDQNPNNDLTNAVFNSITFQGTGGDGYLIDGNAFTLLGGVNDATTGGTADVPVFNNIDADIAVSGNQAFSVTDINTLLGLLGTVSGTGNITFTGNGGVLFAGSNTAYTGTVTANGGTIMAADADALGTSAAPGAVINNGADFTLLGCSGFDFNGNLTLTGNSSIIVGDQPNPKLGSAVGGCLGGGGGSGTVTAYGAPSSTEVVNFKGTIALGSDITFAGTSGITNIVGPLTGAHTITMLPGYTGKLVVASSNNSSSMTNGTYVSSMYEKTLNDSQPSVGLVVYGNNTITVDGERGDSSIYSGGILKGSGTVNSLSVNKDSTVAPGHSPGKLTVKTLLNLAAGATYQAELKDKNEGDFDQLVVGAATDTDNTNPDVTLGDANGSPTLTVSLYDGYKIAKGDQFMIINNLSKTDVKGTFANLPEGATFKVGSAVFAITYKGGDGNDVVLTAQNTPATPDTGFGMVAAHPGATLGLTVVAAGAILMIARRTRLAPAHVRTTTRRRK